MNAARKVDGPIPYALGPRARTLAVVVAKRRKPERPPPRLHEEDHGDELHTIAPIVARYAGERRSLHDVTRLLAAQWSVVAQRSGLQLDDDLARVLVALTAAADAAKAGKGDGLEALVAAARKVLEPGQRGRPRTPLKRSFGAAVERLVDMLRGPMNPPRVVELQRFLPREVARVLVAEVVGLAELTELGADQLEHDLRAWPAWPKVSAPVIRAVSADGPDPAIVGDMIEAILRELFRVPAWKFNFRASE